MTICNRENDGLHSVLATLVSIVSKEQTISKEDLIQIANPSNEKDPPKRLSGTLNTWQKLGLFHLEEGVVTLGIDKKFNERSDIFLDQLQDSCLQLVMRDKNIYPLWSSKPGTAKPEEGTAIAADFCRGVSWVLAQNIYSMPYSYTDVSKLESNQVKSGISIFPNNTRWEGLRPLAIFLGLATGSDNKPFFDPSKAVWFSVRRFMDKGKTLSASDFLESLARILPVIDKGKAQNEVIRALKPDSFTEPPRGHISTALSFALRRLVVQGNIFLETKSDAESRYFLTRDGGEVWSDFTHITLNDGEMHVA